MSLQNVLVTGGSGFIGRHLCQSLVAQGMGVHVLSRDPVRAKASLGDSIQIYPSLSAIDASILFDGVVNLAGEALVTGRWNDRRKQRFYQSRIGTTDSLYDYFARATEPPSVLVSGSAIGYYGPHGGEPLDEAAGVTNCYSHQLCDAWESSAERFQRLGSRVCCVRTGVVLGASGGALARMLPPFKYGLGGRIGSGEQWFSWIHIDDMVGTLNHCLNNGSIKGPVNATAPQAVTNQEFTVALANVLGRPAFCHMPGIVARLVFGEMAEELLLSGQRVVPDKLIRSGYKFRYPDLSAALSQLILS